jgi:NAD(P)-dependent dehydrogenase (short-subunit alcohol dehydrogenase family)
MEGIMANIDFSGRVAIVTGSGGGLGKTYALELAKRGAKVLVNDFGGARDGTGGGNTMADQVVEEIKAAGGEAAANYDGVHTNEGGESIVRQAVEVFGKVDIVINNAGILRDKSFTKMEEDLWDPVIGVHLKGAYNVTRPAFINMRENGYGRIVMTASGTGLFGNFGQTNYGAAKLGCVGLMNSLRIEGAKYNINVNALAPVAGTRMTEDIMPPDVFEKLNPEFVTPVVLYLCSDDCQDSGKIVCTGAGLVQCAGIFVNDGAFLGGEPASPEAIRDNWGKITDPKNLKQLSNVMDQSMEIIKHYS